MKRKGKGKKVVLVIVEGPSDETALGLFFTRFFDKSKVHVEVIHGDLTTKHQAGRIVSAIGDVVKKNSKESYLHREDYQEVIHIVDMDGAYIPDGAVIADSQYVSPFYATDGIRTANVVGIRARNKQKRENLDVLSVQNKVWRDIPYHVFYMSCNLDHVLYDKLNSSDDEKENDAYIFVRRYKDNLRGFLDYLSKSSFSECNGYRESWKFIKEGQHSIERHSNLGLAFHDEW